ncbi:Uncharacterised protein at_DN2671, partial [Pycnogonum litorale]
MLIGGFVKKRPLSANVASRPKMLSDNNSKLTAQSEFRK